MHFWSVFDRADTAMNKIIIFLKLKFVSALITPALSGGIIFWVGVIRADVVEAGGKFRPADLRYSVKPIICIRKYQYEQPNLYPNPNTKSSSYDKHTPHLIITLWY